MSTGRGTHEGIAVDDIDNTADAAIADNSKPQVEVVISLF